MSSVDRVFGWYGPCQRYTRENWTSSSSTRNSARHQNFWAAGKALYDPGDIRVPTFLAHAEWDADLPSYMLYAYFEKLMNVPCKRYVQIGEGTHTVIMEKNRMQLFQAVQQFLDETLQIGE